MTRASMNIIMEWPRWMRLPVPRARAALRARVHSYIHVYTVHTVWYAVRIMLALVSRASPFTKGGRVWSTWHCGFVNVRVSHYFLGLLNHNDALRRKCCLVLCTHANRVACIQYCAVWRAPKWPARTTQNYVSATGTVYRLA